MKTQFFFLMLVFSAAQCFAQKNENDQAFTNVHHYKNNITLTSFDGKRSTISVNGNFATVFNPDGTQTTMNFGRKTSTLVTADGTGLSVFHNRIASTVFNPDGTQITINHIHSISTCLTPKGKHTVRHIFGNAKETRRRKKIDVLVHMNWLVQQQLAEAAAEAEEAEKDEAEDQN